MKYWIIVASKDHCNIGINNGFIQTCHGKCAPLQKMKPNDKVILYASKIEFTSKIQCQEFVAIGTVLNKAPYQLKHLEDFHPYRRDMIFDEKLKPVSILPLINSLDFFVNKSYWGYKFRFGCFSIDEKDYTLIYNTMKIK